MMLGSYQRRASQLAEKESWVIRFITRIFPRLKWLRFTVLFRYIDDVKVLLSLVRDYYTKKYTQIPYRSIVAILSFFLYLVSPFDFVPDFIPFIGYIDDLVVFRFVMKQIKFDLEAYKRARAQWLHSET